MPFKQILKDALKTSLWIIKIIVPTSLVVTFLNYYEVIAFISCYFEPLFKYIGLQGNAAIVFLSSLFLPLYGSIAIMTSLPLSIREISILALMCLITHNLPIESAVQRKSGTPLYVSIIIRILSSISGAIILNNILPVSLSSIFPNSIRDCLPEVQSIFSLISSWAVNTASLCIKIVIIIVSLMLLQDLLKRYGIIDKISKPLSPFMRICGLSPDSSFLWLIAQTVGLAYGAGIMAHEIENSNADKRELILINLHISVNHSLIEDTTLFCMLGVTWYYIVVPRLFFAIVIVWTARLFYYIKSKKIIHNNI